MIPELIQCRDIAKKNRKTGWKRCQKGLKVNVIYISRWDLWHYKKR